MIKTRHAVLIAFIAFLTFTGPGPLTSTAFSQNLQPFITGELANFTLHEARKPLPDISFIDGSGKTRKLSGFEGKVILLNFWATWCAPCRREMPSLDRLQNQIGTENFRVLAIGQDRKGIEKVKAFLQELNVPHLAAYNDRTLKSARKLGVFGLPSTLLIDREGREIGRLTGPAEWDSDAAIALIKAVLSQDDP